MKFNNKLMLMISFYFMVGLLYCSVACANENVSIWFDGKELKTPVSIINDRVMVPLQTIVDCYGADGIIRNEENENSWIVVNDIVLELMTGSTTAFVKKNSPIESVELDTPPMLIESCVFVPLRFVVESLEGKIKWDNNFRKIWIETDYFGKYDPGLSRITDLAPTYLIQSDNPEMMSLANEITSKSQTNIEKVRAIYDWVAQNVTYYKDDVFHDAVSMLHVKKGACSEYSYLTAALLRSLGFPTRVVNGWARSPDETWDELLQRSPNENHAWNEVLVDGLWLQIDTTWGIFNLDSEIFLNNHSKVKPGLPTQAQYYFRIPNQDRNEIIKLIEGYFENMPEFKNLPLPRHLCIITGVGFKDVGKTMALVKTSIYHKSEEKLHFLIRLEKKQVEGWTLIGVTTVSDDYRLPSGAYDLLD